MFLGRCFFLFLFALIALSRPALVSAGWWFGEESGWEKSGLDLNEGYDQNTVVSLNGTVVSVTMGDGREPALAKIKTAMGAVSLVLGPRDFWEKQGISLNPGDSVRVRGSKAQGEDGAVYLMVQTIVKIDDSAGDGQEAVLRSRIGRPAWAGGIRSMQQRPMTIRPMRSGRNR